MLTLAALPWTASLRAPDAPALHTAGATLTYSQLDRAAAGVAARLRRRGVRTGDRVAILCGNTLAFPTLYFGALRAQAVAVPLPVTAPTADLAAQVRRLRIALVAADQDHAAQARSALRSAATGATLLTLRDDRRTPSHTELSLDALTEHPTAAPEAVPPATPAVILNTSGTTGTPRGALHSHAGLLLNARAVAGEILHLDEHDVQLGALPLAHSFGLSAVLNATLLARGSVALMPRFDAHAALEAITAHRVTTLQAVPTMFARLTAAAAAAANGARPPTTLRRVVVSGAPLPTDLARAVHDTLCTTVIERWGMTEVSPLTMRLVPPDGGEPGDVGRPLWNVAVRVAGGLEHGELEATASSMFLGYAGSRRATAEVMHDGFLRTGDLGRVDEDGRVVLSGRLKDLIIRGGYNVPAREVEQVLEGHPAVAEVAVVGLPDADLGEEVAAALVLHAGAHGHRDVPEQLRARCAAQLAAYKRPRRWYVLDELPRTASGKVRKPLLRDLLAECDAVLSERP